SQARPFGRNGSPKSSRYVALLTLRSPLIMTHRRRIASSRRRTGCPQSLTTRSSWRPATSWLTDRACQIRTNAPPPTWTRSSRGGKPGGGAADQVPADHQSEDRQGVGPHDPALGARAGG